jgi:hypothetical protein
MSTKTAITNLLNLSEKEAFSNLFHSRTCWIWWIFADCFQKMGVWSKGMGWIMETTSFHVQVAGLHVFSRRCGSCIALYLDPLSDLGRRKGLVSKVVLKEMST